MILTKAIPMQIETEYFWTSKLIFEYDIPDASESTNTNKFKANE